MSRPGLLVLATAGSAAVLLLLVVWYLSSYQGGRGSMAGMMGQLIGNGGYAGGVPGGMPTYVWVSVVALFVVIAGGVAGLAYYLAYPEIKTAASPADPSLKMGGATASPRESWSVLVRTSKPEEKKVLEVLASHDGNYLQKFIVKESGLSRLRTHRIISRFADRGVVTVIKSGNTNEVALAPWLKQSANQGPTQA